MPVTSRWAEEPWPENILPDLHRRGASKWRLSAAMVAGVAVMGALTFVREAH